MNYKETEFNNRILESQELLAKHPDKIPVIVNCSNNIFLDKRKYLVPSDLNCSQFLFILRKRIKINPEEALFMFVKDTLLISSTTILAMYIKHIKLKIYFCMFLLVKKTPLVVKKYLKFKILFINK